MATMRCRLCPEVTAIEQDATWPDGGHIVWDTTVVAGEAA